ncbi:hypothetical protein BDN72DRAFT_848745 [Pluteus cervinus]|uniref:Uncharacterized protein n=1 Tax=Pluteus cervinus TaxID=181527 RepID=A0ACD3A9T8_9AGAR|nr:hypothetical protein BDN72DRAFT_848745 [Pluteus cervinus]
MAPHQTPVDLLNTPRDELRLQCEKIRLKAAQLKKQLIDLTTEHAELVQVILVYEAALAPWKLIPDEVLQRIFQWTRPTEAPTCVPFSRIVAPMQLTQVCSKWRALAHDTPTIWQGLKCPIYLPPDRYERQETIAFIQSWLSRAAYLPLSIVAVPLDLGPGILPMGVRAQMAPQVMHGSNTGRGAPFHPWLLLGNKFNLIKDVIIPNAPRIRDLHITFPPYYRHTLALLQENVDFPLLEDVALDFDRDLLGISLPAPTYTFLENTPRLRKLRFGSQITSLLVNWSHLTHFEMGVVSPTGFMQILGQMTSLQYCKVGLRGFELPPPPIPGPPPQIQPPNPVPNQPNVPHLAPHFMQNVQIALHMPGPGPALPSHHAPINIPSLHTLHLDMGFLPSMMHPITSYLENLEFPNLKVFSLSSMEWSSLAHSLFGTTSLLELNIKIQGSLQHNILNRTLNNPVLSQLTHLSIRVRDRHFLAPPTESIDGDTLKAIAEGQLIPQLHTFEFEGRLGYSSLIHLLVTKGFVSDGDTNDLESASVIYPDIDVGYEQQLARPAEGVVAPFQKVELYRCQPNFLMDPALMKIQKLVGADRFMMKASDLDEWGRMNQIDWNMDE